METFRRKILSTSLNKKNVSCAPPGFREIRRENSEKDVVGRSCRQLSKKNRCVLLVFDKFGSEVRLRGCVTFRVDIMCTLEIVRQRRGSVFGKSVLVCPAALIHNSFVIITAEAAAAAAVVLLAAATVVLLAAAVVVVVRIYQVPGMIV